MPKHRAAIITIAMAIMATIAWADDIEFGFEVGYASRYVTEGIDNLPDADGIVQAEATVGAYGLTLGGVFVQGIKDSYNEANIFLEYGFEMGTFAPYVGVQFLTFPAGDEDPDSWEAFVGFEWDVIDWVSLFGEFYYDFDDVDGGFLELGLATEIPHPVEGLSLVPCALIGFDAGFVSGPRRLNENNVIVGLEAEFAINEFTALFAGVHHSFALSNLDDEEEGDMTWFTAGLSLAF